LIALLFQHDPVNKQKQYKEPICETANNCQWKVEQIKTQ